MSVDTLDVWGDALDALAVRLGAQADFLAGYGLAPEGEWTPPTGPMPAEYELRAAVLLAQSEDLARRAATARGRVGAAVGTTSPYR